LNTKWHKYYENIETIDRGDEKTKAGVSTLIKKINPNPAMMPQRRTTRRVRSES
jgi:hypothetical protein